MLSLDEKYQHALEARKRSYSPYSNFKVGAVVVLNDGTLVYGCNVENASYGLSNCAERSAIFNAISSGYDYKSIVELIVIADSKRPISPCGACRQVMAEFLNQDTIITLFNLEKQHISFLLKDLLPYSFDQGDLDAK